jgi:hypothetical protein
MQHLFPGCAAARFGPPNDAGGAVAPARLVGSLPIKISREFCVSIVSTAARAAVVRLLCCAPQRIDRC